MYKEYYKLKDNPFNIASDPAFVFETENFKEGLVNLVYGIEKKDGLILITGDIGSGKTTLCKYLLKSYIGTDKDKKISTILNPVVPERDMLRGILKSFQIKREETIPSSAIPVESINKQSNNDTSSVASTMEIPLYPPLTKGWEDSPVKKKRSAIYIATNSTPYKMKTESTAPAVYTNPKFNNIDSIEDEMELMNLLNSALLENKKEGITPILIIDDAHMLNLKMLEYICILSNLEDEGKKLIQIILIGQPEINKKLGMPELRQLNQRISVRHKISYLNKKEVKHYIGHRLQISSKDICNVNFTPYALYKLYNYSHGCQRVINHICDRAMLSGSILHTNTIDGNIIKSSINSFKGDDPNTPEYFSSFNSRLKTASNMTMLFATIVLLLGIVFGIVGISLYNGNGKNSIASNAMNNNAGDNNRHVIKLEKPDYTPPSPSPSAAPPYSD